MTTPHNNNNCKVNKKKKGDKVRLGSHAKCILLLMLRGDEPKGRPIPILVDLAKKFKLDYSSSMSKKYQHLKFKQERNLRQTLHRLAEKGFLTPIVVVQPNTSVVVSPKRYGYNFYSLTPKGRLIAEKIQQQQEQTLRDMHDLQVVLDVFRGLGYSIVSVEQVRHVLWQTFSAKFIDKAEFDMYWNNTWLGLLLHRCTFGRVRAWESHRPRKYRLQRP